MDKVTKPKLFLETTVFNFYEYGKAQEKQQFTRKLFEAIAGDEYIPFTSTAVIAELLKDTREKEKGRLRLIDTYKITVLNNTEESDRLAGLYIGRDIIPANYTDDARHIAAATVYGLDCVVSFNFGHIVKSKTMIGTGLLNKREGYLPIVISTPKEIIEYDQIGTDSRE
jgi:hypothetical protein